MRAARYHTYHGGSTRRARNLAVKRSLCAPANGFEASRAGWRVHRMKRTCTVHCVVRASSVQVRCHCALYPCAQGGCCRRVCRDLKLRWGLFRPRRRTYVRGGSTAAGRRVGTIGRRAPSRCFLYLRIFRSPECGRSESGRAAAAGRLQH